MQPGPGPDPYAGAEALLHRDRRRAAVARSRGRRPGRGALSGPVVPPLWVMPEERAAFLAVAAARPEWSFLQRPRGEGPATAQVRLEDPDRVEPGPNWVVEQEMGPGHLPGADASRQRWHIVVVGVAPLAVLVSPAPSEKVGAALAAVLAGAREELAREGWDPLPDPDGCRPVFAFDFVTDADGGSWLVDVMALPVGEPGPEFVVLEPPEGWLAWLALARPGEGAGVGTAVPSPDVRVWALGPGLALHSPRDEEVHLLDATAAYVWTALAEGLTAEEAAAELASAVPGAAERAGSDVWNLLGTWADHGLLSGPPRAVPPMRYAVPARRRPLGWNLEAAYSYLGVTVGVRVPSVDAAGWVSLAAGALEVPLPPASAAGADGVDEWIEVAVDDRRRWTVSGPGLRLVCSDVRQVGAAVRETIIRLAAGRSDVPALEATLLESSGGRVAVVVGMPGVRVELAAAWLDGGTRCLADDLAVVGPDGLTGRAVGIEEPWTGDWYGPMPEWDQDNPLAVTPLGDFVRHRQLPVTVEGAVRPACLISLHGASAAPGPMVPGPVGEAQAVQDLLGSRPRGARRITASGVEWLLSLVAGMACYRAAPGDPRLSVAVLARLLRSDTSSL